MGIQIGALLGFSQQFNVLPTDSRIVPQYIYAGDSLSIKFNSMDYPSTAWTGSFFLNGPTSGSVIGTGSATNDYTFNLSETFTDVPPAQYFFAISVNNATERHTVFTGYTVISPNPATTPNQLQHCEKMINAIEAVLEGRVTDDVQSLVIGGRSLTHLSIQELRELRANYYRERAILVKGAHHDRTVVPFGWNVV